MSTRPSNASILLIRSSPQYQHEVTERIYNLIARECIIHGLNEITGHCARSIGQYNLLSCLDGSLNYEVINQLRNIRGLKKVSAHCATMIHQEFSNDECAYKEISGFKISISKYPYCGLLFLKVCNHLLLMLGSEVLNDAIDMINGECEKLKRNNCDFVIDIYSLKSSQEFLCIIRTKELGVLWRVFSTIANNISYESNLNKLSKHTWYDEIMKNKNHSLFSMHFGLEGICQTLVHDIGKFNADYFGSDDYYHKFRRLENIFTDENIHKIADLLKDDNSAVDTVVFIRMVSGNTDKVLQLLNKCAEGLTNDRPLFFGNIGKFHLAFRLHNIKASHLVLFHTKLYRELCKYVRDNALSCPLYSIQTEILYEYKPKSSCFESNRFNLEKRFGIHLDEHFLALIWQHDVVLYCLLENILEKYRRCVTNDQIYLYFLPLYKFILTLIETIYNTFNLLEGDDKHLKKMSLNDLERHFKKRLRDGSLDTLVNVLDEAAILFEKSYDQLFTNSYTVVSDVDDSTYGFIIGYQRVLLVLWGLHAYLLEQAGEPFPSGICLLGTKPSVRYDWKSNVIYSPLYLTRRIEDGFLIAPETGHAFLRDTDVGRYTKNILAIILFDEIGKSVSAGLISSIRKLAGKFINSLSALGEAISEIEKMIGLDAEFPTKRRIANILSFHQLNLVEALYSQSKEDLNTILNLLNKSILNGNERLDDELLKAIRRFNEKFDSFREEHLRKGIEIECLEDLCQPHYRILDEIFCDLFAYEFYYYSHLKGSGIDPLTYFIRALFNYAKYTTGVVKSDDEKIMVLFRAYVIFCYDRFSAGKHDFDLDRSFHMESVRNNEIFKEYISSINAMRQNDFDNPLVSYFDPLLPNAEQWVRRFLSPICKVMPIFVKIFYKLLAGTVESMDTSYAVQTDEPVRLILANDSIAQAIKNSMVLWEFQRRIDLLVREHRKNPGMQSTLRRYLINIRDIEIMAALNQIPQNPGFLKELEKAAKGKESASSREDIRHNIEELFLNYAYLKLGRYFQTPSIYAPNFLNERIVI
jgi:hypothetical protein